MKIAVISIIRAPWGGSEELWAAYASEAIKNGHEIIISIYDCGKLSDKTQMLVEKGAKIDLRIGTIQKKLSFWKYLMKRFRRIYDKIIGNSFSNLFKYHPNVILYVGTAYSIAKDRKLLQLLNKNNLSFFINVQLNYEQNKIELSARDKKTIIEAYNLAKKVLFVSERNKQIAEIHLNYKIKNGIVVRNPVNLMDRTIVPFPQEKIIQLALVGNLITIHKGQDIALNVLKNKIWEPRSWHLNIYGSGSDENYLKKLCNENNLEDRVSFHGKADDIRALWKKNHILLMPSRMEGMPLVIVEAMLCGRPCVATNVGGISEWIEENKSGFIAEATTQDSFGNALEKAWQHKDQWEEMGKQAHERATQLYDPNPGKTLLDLIRK